MAAIGLPEEDVIGQTVSHFRVVEKIGEGGMGAVWKAEDTLLDRVVALKFLPEALAESEEARRRLLREARSAAALHHPGISTVFEVGDHRGQVFIALRYVDGEPLGDHLRAGPIAIPRALQIAREAADALAYAHAHGILHRDISARNVMLDREGRAVMIDFGLALPEDATRLTMTRAALGTAAYMAPEAARGDTSDRRSDVYSLGVVLYEMVTGTVPFRSARPEALLYAAVHEAPEAPSRRRDSIPPGLDELLLRMLAKNPADRPQSMEEVSSELTALLGDASADGSRSGGARIDPEATGRRRSILPLWVGGVTLLAAFASAWWIFMESDSGSGQAERIPRIAVLPFQNPGETPMLTEPYSDAIGQAITARLPQAGIRVTPWVTSLRHRNDPRTLPEIADQLEVDGLLTGTFHEVDGKFFLTVELVDGESGFVEWPLEFEEEHENLIALRGRVAAAIARKLLGENAPLEDILVSENDPDPSNLEAYEFYLRGARLVQEDDKRFRDLAIRYFRRSLERDPGLAAAHVGLGSVLSNLYFRGEAGQAELSEAEKSFETALSIEPDLVAAHRGLVHANWLRGHSLDVARHGRRALELSAGTVEGLVAAGEACFLAGLSARGAEFLRQAVELDPTYEAAHWFGVVAATWAGQWKDAIERSLEYERRFGEDAEMLLWRGVALHNTGDDAAATAAFDRALGGMEFDSNLYALGIAGVFYERMGEVDKARSLYRGNLSELAEIKDRHLDNPRARAFHLIPYALLGGGPLLDEEARALVAVGAEHPIVYHLLAIAYAILGDDGRALSLLDAGAVRGSLGVAPGLLWGLPDIQALVVRSHRSAILHLEEVAPSP